METKKQIQDAIDMLQTLQSDLSKNEGVSKEHILTHLKGCENDCNEEIESNLTYLREYCKKLIDGTTDADFFFKQVEHCKEIYNYDTGRKLMIEGVIYSIENNFNEED